MTALSEFMAGNLPKEVEAKLENEPIPEPEKPTPLYPIKHHSIALLTLQNDDGSFSQSDKLDGVLRVENLSISMIRIALSGLLFGKAPTDEQKSLFTTAFVKQFLSDEAARLNTEDAVEKIEEAEGKDVVEVRSWAEVTKLAEQHLGVNTAEWEAKADAFLGDKVNDEWRAAAKKVSDKVAKKYVELLRNGVDL